MPVAKKKTSNTVTKKLSYNATVSLTFDYPKGRVNIEPEKISYVMIESDYENNVLPVIYISLAVNDDLYNKINKYRSDATFSLTIKKYTLNTRTPLYKTILSDSFNYIPSTNSANYTEDLNKDTLADDSYKRIMIGLVSATLTNTLRRDFNGNATNTDQATLISYALEGTKPIIEPLYKNKAYKSIIVPPLSTIYQFLRFMFERDAYYETNFRFFMDFNRSYLTSTKGEGVDAKDGHPNNVIIDIQNVTSNTAYYDGINLGNDAYYVYVNPVDTNVIADDGKGQIVTNVVTVDEDEGNSNMDLDISTTNGMKKKTTYVRSKMPGVIKNEAELGLTIIEIVKKHIDGSIFTPNKRYTIKNFGDNSDYDGIYLMSYKREFFKCSAGDFSMTCNVGFKMVGRLNDTIKNPNTKSTTYKRSENKAVKSSSKKSSTAAKRNILNSTKAK